MKRTGLLLITLLALVFLSLFVGAKSIRVSDFFNLSDDERLVMLISRVPRAIAIVLAGIGLSVSGLIMQRLAQNKFVAPTTIGTFDAAKLGILFSVILIPYAGAFNKMLFALVFTFIASVVFLKMTSRVKHRGAVFIPLVGIMFGSVLNAIATFFGYHFNIIQNMNAWLVGDFSVILKGRYELLYICLPAVVLTYWYANKFTVVGMGESFAINLGLNYNNIVRIGQFCVCLTVSIVMITVGAIPFLGLIIPNIVSMLAGDNLRKTLPYTALGGAIFLLICDIMSRLIIYPYEVPIGVTVGILGGIIFFYLLFKRK